MIERHPASRVAAVLLAAGRSTRFGLERGASKLTAPVFDEPMVRRTAAAALASRAERLVVVTGHAADAVAQALEGLPVRFAFNRDYRTGMASSLKAGLAALSAEIQGALILLADMPLVQPTTMDLLIDDFARAPADIDAVIPVFESRRCNPVLLGRRLFEAVERLDGDEGARSLVLQPAKRIVSRIVDDPGVAIDVDTNEALARLANLSAASPEI